ncbi:formate/nitrite transporter family protein [Indiicoccus explosivorum]|uniref:formate/nitrite transporter family protein n=1 Tax=Indiicoccus explosivorum TaxID=1917864 RepID=UPI000B4472AB|nr:formate/nitrite transporter family protein [Indiicoccus explosivorum]
MDYVKPEEMLENVAAAGAKKAAASVRDILIKGTLSGAFLGISTVLAYTVAVQTGLDFIGAFVFPVGFVMILLLNLELVTGNFAMVSLAGLRDKATLKKVLYNFFWAFTGNLIGSLLFAVMFVIYITKFGHVMEADVIQKIIQVAEGKTFAYKEYGADGIIVAFVKAILCNWMVTLGAIMAFTSHSTIGKITAMWLPVFLFFTLGLEHAVVNMFVIPSSMMLNSGISFTDWWLWNQLIVTSGNLLGGFLLTGLSLHLVIKDKPAITETPVKRKTAS